MDSTSLRNIVAQATEKYPNNDNQFKIVTDFHITVDTANGTVVICDDEETLLSSGVIDELCSCDEQAVETILKNGLAQMDKDGIFNTVGIYKPFSFLLEDTDNETIAELLIVDDENVFVSDELLKGLDKELNEFLADLMKD
jgi:hypothetical protein